jgi:Secretion system C-terminal sorting domain
MNAMECLVHASVLQYCFTWSNYRQWDYQNVLIHIGLNSQNENNFPINGRNVENTHAKLLRSNCSKNGTLLETLIVSVILKITFMKTLFTLLALLAVSALGTSAQTVYAVNSNGNYSANCNNCTFNIANGITLTINNTGTCNNCTFNGGNIEVKKDIICQPCTFSNNTITMNNQVLNPNSGTTSFTNVKMVVKGSGSVAANAPVTIINSVFPFNDNAYYNNNGGQLDINGSTINFNNNANFNATAGPVNLKNSKIFAGDGLLSSRAYVKMNGAALNLYDISSSVVLGNNNNYYFNWNTFNSISNSKTYTTTYPSTPSTMNCGAAGQNACGMWGTPTVFGPATFASNGVTGISSTLAVLLTGFTIKAPDDKTVALDWSTQQEVNALYFDVQRSANGSTWDKVGSVSAKGYASNVTHYTYTDNTPLNGVGYYRLKMVATDGKQAYSEIRTIHASLVKGISCFPNPATDHINVSVNGTTRGWSVKLINQSGSVLHERKATANTTMVSVNTEQYPGGMYILSVIAADGAEQNTKLMIVH